MRMTKQLQEAFVKGVLADVPTLDYQGMLLPIVLADFVGQLPEPVRAIWNGPLRDYVNLQYFSAGDGSWGDTTRWHYSCEVPWPTDCARDNLKLTPAGQKNVDALTKKWAAQNKRIATLKTKLEGAVKAYTTVKTLREALPEFAKYLPAEDATPSNLPALANVVSDLVQAGWPNGKTPEELSK